MATFLKLHLAHAIHEAQWVNIDMVLEICPPQKTTYGCRLIHPCMDSDDNDFMASDVMETPEEIFKMMDNKSGCHNKP